MIVNQKPRRRVCIIALSEVRRDARVLRQIEFLSREYDLTVIGHGSPDPAWPRLVWIPIEPGLRSLRRANRLLRMARVLVRLALGRFVRRLQDRPIRELLLEGALFDAILGVRADVYWANDWEALPAAADAAKRYGGKLIFDAHEYVTHESDHDVMFRLRDAPLIDHVLRLYAPLCDASLTVCKPLAERYAREYGLRPIVVRNAPALTQLPTRSSHPADEIRLVHHGGAVPARRLDLMIDAVAVSDDRFSLTFMLIGNPRYIETLRTLAARRAPGRVFFIEPVHPADIPRKLSEFDMGLYLLQPRTYNDAMALPNKLFDFLVAGLPVCIGPSPAMAELVREYACGVVAPSTRAKDVARTLAAVDSEALGRMRAGAGRARVELNAESEMPKAVRLVASVLSDTPATVRGA